jgi:hypothetical protein
LSIIGKNIKEKWGSMWKCGKLGKLSASDKQSADTDASKTMWIICEKCLNT